MAAAAPSPDYASPTPDLRPGSASDDSVAGAEAEVAGFEFTGHFSTNTDELNEPWSELPQVFEGKEFTAPPPQLLKRRLQALASWTEHEVRGMRAQALKSRGEKRNPKRALRKPVELKAAALSQGSRPPIRVDKGSTIRYPSSPYFPQLRPGQPSSHAASWRQDDFAQVVSSNSDAAMSAELLLKRQPASSHRQRQRRTLLPESPGGGGTVTTLPLVAQPEVTLHPPEPRSIPLQPLSPSQLTRAFQQETNNGLMGGTLFLDQKVTKTPA